DRGEGEVPQHLHQAARRRGDREDPVHGDQHDLEAAAGPSRGGGAVRTSPVLGRRSVDALCPHAKPPGQIWCSLISSTALTSAPSPVTRHPHRLRSNSPIQPAPTTSTTAVSR